jgi:hypothetical protein
MAYPSLIHYRDRVLENATEQIGEPELARLSILDFSTSFPSVTIIL